MKHFFALLLSVLMVLSLLTACGDKVTPSDDSDQTVTDENGGDTDNNTPDDTADPYDAVRSYWSEDQLTQAWGPDQVVEHLFFHPIIAYPQWAFHDCNALMTTPPSICPSHERGLTALPTSCAATSDSTFPVFLSTTHICVA